MFGKVVEEGVEPQKGVCEGLEGQAVLGGGGGGGEGGASKGLAKGLAYPGTEGIEGTCGSCLPLFTVLDLGVEVAVWAGGLNVDGVDPVSYVILSMV